MVGRSRSRRFAGYAFAEEGEIRLAVHSEAVLLHEVAHVATPGDGHGDRFLAALVEMVRHRMGFFAYGSLTAELRQAGLWSPLTSPPIELRPW